MNQVGDFEIVVKNLAMGMNLLAEATKQLVLIQDSVIKMPPKKPAKTCPIDRHAKIIPFPSRRP